MINAHIQIVGLKDVQDEFRDINANQIPFATALALTRTAQDAQKVIRDVILPEHFTLRQPAFIKKGVRITAATKLTLQAVVEDIDKFMEIQESGGVKFAYGEYIAVPLSSARRSYGSLIPEESRPHAVMQRGGFIRGNIMYAVTFKRGRAKRLSRAMGYQFGTEAPQWSRNIVPMYALVKSAKIKPRYGFIAAGVATVEKNFAVNFENAFRQAVRTAR